MSSGNSRPERPMSEMLTVPTVAANLGCSQTLVRRYCRDGRLRSTRIMGTNMICVDPDDLAEFANTPRPVGRPPAELLTYWEFTTTHRCITCGPAAPVRIDHTGLACCVSCKGSRELSDAELIELANHATMIALRAMSILKVRAT